MVSWEWIARRRGITIESVIRSGVDTFEAMEQYCRDRDISAPTRDEYVAAHTVVNPPVVKKPTASKRPAAKKPAAAKKPIRKRSARKSKLGT